MVALRRIIVISAAAFALASGAVGQTISRTFHLTTVPNQAGLNEIATIIRTLEAGVITVDPTKQDITVGGTADELALAAWLVQQLDTQNPPPATPRYTVSGSDNGSVRIFFLAHTPAQAPLNEFVTTLRTVGDIQRIFTYSPQKAIAIRTTAAKAQFADWMVHLMDVTPDSHTHITRTDFALKECSGGLAEVAFLAHPVAQPGLNEIVVTLRVVADVQGIFTHTSAPQGIAFRGCPSQVQLADWLIQQLDSQPDAQARAQKHEYLIPNSTDPVIRVYYPKTNEPAALNQMATAIRSEANVRKIFTCPTSGTLALRATPDSVAIADRIIEELDR